MISVKETSFKNDYFKSLREGEQTKTLPKWLSLEVDSLKGTVLALPQRDDIDLSIEEHQIVEFYSR